MPLEPLRRHLQSVMAPALLEHLEAGLGWAVESAGRPLHWERDGEIRRDLDILRWTLAEATGLRAEVTLVLDPAHHAAILQITLRNPTTNTSIPLSAIKPAHLRWANVRREDVQVRTLGGGMTGAYYPPGAYREHAVWLRPGLSQALTIESGQDGRSSNRDLPFLQMTLSGSIGAGLIVALEWSGEWRQSFGPAWSSEGSHDGLNWEAAIPIKGLSLAPGESLALPAAHLISFEGDQDDGGNACRRYIYDRISPDLNGRRPVPPASYDHWFGIGCDFDEALLRRQVDRAVELDLEYFVLDAGWFAGCGAGYDFSSGTGNWERVDSTKFPEGLESFAAYVRERGLKFGLWFETERAHRDSDLVRDHPDWFFDIGTTYLHLNLAIPEVQDYLIRMIGTWIERLDLEWSRWDYNIGPKPYWEHADPTGKIQFSYMAGLYRVLDTLIKAHPRWLVECCASGGRRIDMGTLRRAHTIWFSDHTHDALVCRFMQTGANRFLPGHLLNSSVVGMKDGSEAEVSDAAMISRMCGAFAVNGDTSAWSPEVVTRMARLVGIYKEFRHLLTGDFYPLTPQPGRADECDIVQFMDRDARESVVLGFSSITAVPMARVRLKGLDRTAEYRVWDPLHGGKQQEQGAVLLDQGIDLSLVTGAAILKLERRHQ